MRLARLLLLAISASAHSYHSSIAQLDYISSRKTLEAIVWLHTEDVERAFQHQLGPNANFDDAKAAARFVSDYLRTHFELRNHQGKLLEQKWVGLEVKVHFVAAYFEVPLNDGLTSLTLTNRLFLDRLPDQMNNVQVQQDGKPRGDLQFNNTGAPLTQPLVKR